MKRMFILLSLLLLTACSSQQVQMKFVPQPIINPDALGHSLPVVVRILQLKDDNAFYQATYEQLWRDPKSLLSNDLLSEQDVMVIPSKPQKVILQKKKGAKYLAAVAIFRKGGNGPWRTIMPMPRGIIYLPSTVTIDIDGNNLRLNGERDA